MEDPKSVVVLDISSDEEVDCVDITRGLRKLLDDECVVLDGDPDKPRMVENVYCNDDDDCVVVSEKGEVACRDFPHPRDHCTKYPFSSSRHDMHCDKCHCYVCESLAPCADWGTGVSSFDHCHASDKQAFWTSQRMSLRNVKLPMPIPVPPDHNIATSLTSSPMPYQTAPLVPNLVHQNQGLKSETTVNSLTLNNDRPCMACISNERLGDSHMPDRSSPLVPNIVPQNQCSRQLPPISDRSPLLVPNLVPQNQVLREPEIIVNLLHPRHLCVKYPYSSSRPELYCDQCLCYICNKLAPCQFWTIAHCRASERSRFGNLCEGLRKFGTPTT